MDLDKYPRTICTVDEPSPPTGGGATMPSGDAASPPAPKEGTPPPAPPSPSLSPEDIKKINDTLTELKMENQMLTGRLQGIAQGGVRPIPEKPAPPKLELPSNEAFLEEMKTKPVETLARLISQVTNHEVGPRISGVKEEISTAVAGREQYNSAVSVDRSRTQTQYAEYLDVPEFRAECERIYSERVRGRGGYLPGDLEDSAAQAFVALSRAGKLPSKQAAPAPQTGGRRLQLTPTGGTNGSSTGSVSSNGKPRTIDEMPGWSTEERSIAKRNAAKWGIPESEWIDNYLSTQNVSEEE